MHYSAPYLYTLFLYHNIIVCTSVYVAVLDGTMPKHNMTMHVYACAWSLR